MLVGGGHVESGSGHSRPCQLPGEECGTQTDGEQATCHAVASSLKPSVSSDWHPQVSWGRLGRLSHHISYFTSEQ